MGAPFGEEEVYAPFAGTVEGDPDGPSGATRGGLPSPEGPQTCGRPASRSELGRGASASSGLNPGAAPWPPRTSWPVASGSAVVSPRSLCSPACSVVSPSGEESSVAAMVRGDV